MKATIIRRRTKTEAAASKPLTRTHDARGLSHRRSERGFKLLELMIVVSILIVIAGFSIPRYLTLQQSLRIGGDIRRISTLVAQAKVRGPANFTHARVYVNLAANSAGYYTYHLDIWNKAGNSGAGCWQTDGDTVNSCIVAATSPVQYLSNGVTPGYGTVSTPPANTEGTLGQAPGCFTGYAGQAGYTPTANTACIEFNSRGSPVDPSNNGTSNANGAFYLTDGNSVYGVTVLASGLVQTWYTHVSTSAVWVQQ